MSSLKENETLVIGIGVCFLSATLSNLGQIVMKSVVTAKGHEIRVETPRDGEDEEVSEFEKNTAVKRKESLYEDFRQTKATSLKVLSRANVTWFAGVLSFFTGQILNLVSLSYLKEVVWAVLSLFSLVTNAVFSSLILGEAFTVRDFLSTCFVILGSTLVVVANDSALSAGEENVSAAWTINVFLKHFTRPWFLVYCGFLAMVLVTSILHGVRDVGRGHTVHALTWTILSATSGSVSVLLGKCIVGFIDIIANTPGGLNSPEGRALLTSVSTYVIIVVFCIAAISALVSLNLALAAGEALLVVPWLTVTNTLLAILGGIFYFEEFSSFRSVPRASLFIGGVALAIAGSILLQRGRVEVQSARRISVDSVGGILDESIPEFGVLDRVELPSHEESRLLLNGNGPPVNYSSNSNGRKTYAPAVKKK